MQWGVFGDGDCELHPRLDLRFVATGREADDRGHRDKK
jgi:hypothetical protein